MSSFITSVLGFVVAIGVLVIIHELGHFSVARLAGVKVLRFSIGFGKPIFQHRARNGTEWSLGWLPLGGYVKMLDEREFVGANADGVDETDANGQPARVSIDPRDLPHAFNRQSLAKRFAIVAAGPIANFLLAIFLFAVLFLYGSPQPQAIIGTPVANSAAAAAGLVNGERIVGIRRPDASDPIGVRSWPELQARLSEAAQGQRALTLLTVREGGRYEHRIDLDTPRQDAAASAGSAVAAIGTGAADLSTRLGLTPGGGAPQVAAVEPDSPAQKAGLMAGDQITTVDGVAVSDAQQLVMYMRAHPSQVVNLGVVRGGGNGHDADGGAVTLRSVRTIHVTPALTDDSATGAKVGRIGAALGSHLPMVDVRYGPIDAIRMGAARTWDIAAVSVKMFGQMLTGKASLKNLSGPVTIADYAGRSARMGPEAFLSFMALVSISLGVLNLLPIPVLDGGHLLYYAVEAVTGRAPSERWQSIMQRAGLLCIVALSVVALFNDLARLIHL